MQLIYPIVFFSYHPILDCATQRSVFYLCKVLLLCGTSWANRQAYSLFFGFFLLWGRCVVGCSRDKHGKGCVTTKWTSVWHPTADFVLSAKSFVFYFCPPFSPFVLNPSSFVSMLRTPLEEDPLRQVFPWDKFRLASTHLWDIPYSLRTQSHLHLQLPRFSFPL